MSEIVVTRRTFLIGLIIAILASSLISTVITTQWARGPQGPVGPQGEQGEQGPAGQDGSVEADLSAYLESDLMYVSSKTILTFTGFMINFGVQPAYNVQIDFTFTIFGGEYRRTYELTTPLWGHDIRSLWIQFSFDLDFSSYSYRWDITWD